MMEQKATMSWWAMTKVTLPCALRCKSLLIVAGGEGGISGKGHEFLLPEVDSSIEPEQTPRWGVVMAQQSQFESKSASEV